jgi:hypothetical protein
MPSADEVRPRRDQTVLEIDGGTEAPAISVPVPPLEPTTP